MSCTVVYCKDDTERAAAASALKTMGFVVHSFGPVDSAEADRIAGGSLSQKFTVMGTGKTVHVVVGHPADAGPTAA